MRRPTLGLAVVFVALALGVHSTALAQSKTWTADADFDAGALDNVVHTPSDQLVLGPTLVSQTHTTWATNYLYGYVVKLDTLTGKQIGRYDSALETVGGFPSGARPVREYCNFASTGNCPGRVAVDANGDAWIVNRAFGHQGTVAKIAGDVSRCVDRNSDSIIQTSSDQNADGIIDVTNPAEFLGQNDECLLTTFPVGPNNVYPRSVSVDRNGKVWVGTHVDGKLYRYASAAPYALEATVTVGGNPYSTATGGDYVFVSNSSAGGTKRVHITSLAIQSVGCPQTYGVVGDPAGDVAWLGGYFTGSNNIYRADFAAGTCMAINVGGVVTAMTLDLSGNVWAAAYNSHTVKKVSPAGVLLGSYPAGGTNPHGLSVDFQGNIWTVLHGPPSYSKINANTGAILGTYTLGGPGIPNADPYLYGDYTGVQIDRQAPYIYSGTWEGIHDGQAAGLAWSAVSWNAEPQGDVPTLTSLTVSVRAADTLPALAAATYVPAVNAGALSGVVGRYVQVKAELAGPGWKTPALSDLTVTGPCTVPGDSCCLTDGDCADASPCTTDFCPTVGGACAHDPIPDCCVADGDCADADACTADDCPAPGGSCVHAAVICDDGNACTADACDPGSGACVFTPLADGTACSDGEACTTNDVCLSGACGHAVTTWSVPAAGACTTGDPRCPTIQAAIDAADTDDVILVAAGIYPENLVLAKRLTLQGAQAGASGCGRSAAESEVSGADATGRRLELQTCSAGSVVDGFTFSGGDRTIESTSGRIDRIQIRNNRVNGFTASGLFLNDNGNDITVSGNELDGAAKSGSGDTVHLDQDDFDGFWFLDNCIVYTGSSAAAPGTGFFVDGNHNVGPSTGAGGRAPLFRGNAIVKHTTGANLGRFAFDGGTIGANRFAENAFDGLQGGIQNTTIVGNTFDRNGRHGLALTGFSSTVSSDPTRGARNAAVIQNCFTNNGVAQAGAGISFSAFQFPGTIATNVAHDNSFSGNRRGALYNGSETIDLESNYWGHPTGPDNPSQNPGGLGDPVDDPLGGGVLDLLPFSAATALSCPCSTPYSCDDNDACTTDTCDPATGLCVHAAVTCDDGNSCTDDTCDPSTGCVFADDDTNACSDGNACTEGDACAGGTCAGTVITCDDGNACTDDTCDPATGCVSTDDDANACSDGNACTAGDACVSGACVGAAVTCDDGNPCTDDACDPAAGCYAIPDDTNPCSDDNACTSDVCMAGSCASAAIPCNDGNACTDDSCNPASGCIYTNDDTNSCSDNNACTTDSCLAGSCQSAAIHCNDGNACTNDSCNPATGCVTSPVSCDDGNACTSDSCDPASGCRLTTIHCNDNNWCTNDSCNPAMGCVHAPVTCDDGNACTNDACNAASGCASTLVTCNDGSVCTNDSCDPATGCRFVPLDCDDGNACTADACNPASGCSHTSVSCFDGDSCTTDSCDPATGCQHGSLTCNDNNPCTDDSCSPGSGCVFTPNNGNACTDGNACTTDVCAGGACVGTAIACNDGNPCTDDSCDPATGCAYQNDDANTCSDGSACTADACTAGACVSAPVTCNDNNPCTDDGCNPASGCFHNPDDTNPCNDGSACTADACIAGACASAPVACNDGNPCTDDGCDPASGCFYDPDDTNACNDGNACTTDACVSGACQSSPSTDPDGDGVCSPPDNCPSVPNSDQADADHDGLGDACDACPHDPLNDSDGDGVCGDVDNCPIVANPDQADADGNGIGDACDGCPDSDGDGIDDCHDGCPDSILDPTVVIPPAVPGGPPPPSTALPCDTGVPNVLIPPSSSNPTPGCTIADRIAACDAASQSSSQFQKCVKSLTKQLKLQGIITEKQRKAIDRCAKRYKRLSVHAQVGGSTIGASEL